MRSRAHTILSALLLAGCGASSVPPGEVRPPASTESSAVRNAEEIEVSGALLPPMPVAVTSFGAATDGAYLYVLGGYFGTPHDYRPEGQSRSLSRVRLDGAAPWEEIARLDAGLQGLALVAHDGRLCRAGGNHTIARGRMRSVPDAACYSLASGRWEPLPDLPEGRSSHGAATIGDTLYVAGGWRLDGTPSDAEWHASVLALELDASAPAWRSIEAPFQRRAVGVAAAGGLLYVVGGLTPEREVSRRVDVFDPATGRWSRGPDFPSDAFGVAAVGVGDAVIASARDGAVHRLRPGAQAWERAGSLAFGRFFHQLVDAGDGSVVAVGGIGGMHTDGRTRHVERVVLDAREPSLASWTMEYPGAARNRQGVFLHDDFLYLFGGNDSLEQHDFAPESFESEGWRLHLPSMTWERVADYPHRRQTMQTVEVDGVGISVGGFGHDGTAAVSHADAYELDFATGRWRERGGLPLGRTQFGLVAHGGRLWIFGGLSYDPSREGSAAFDHLTSVLSAPIDDREATFQPADAELPGPRRAFAGAALGDRYYLIGGMREGFSLVDDCLVFDVASRSFSAAPCPRATRLSAEMVALGGRLYLASGSIRRDGSMESDRSIEVFDPDAQAWSVLVEQLPFDTRHARVLAYRDRLLIVSTHREDGRIRIALVDPALRSLPLESEPLAAE